LSERRAWAGLKPAASFCNSFGNGLQMTMIRRAMVVHESGAAARFPCSGRRLPFGVVAAFRLTPNRV